MAKASSETLYNNRGEVIELNLFEVHEGEVPWWEIDDCKRRKKAYRQQWRRVRDRLHPGVHAESMRRYYEEHPGAHAEANRKHEGRHPGAHAEAKKKYYLTPKGRAAYAKGGAKRREHSTDPELYAARVELLHMMQEPCAACGAPYLITYVIDHILALCLGGTDDWDNLQPLCIRCHREKTEEDMHKFRDAQRMEKKAEKEGH